MPVTESLSCQMRLSGGELCTEFLDRSLGIAGLIQVARLEDKCRVVTSSLSVTKGQGLPRWPYAAYVCSGSAHTAYVRIPAMPTCRETSADWPGLKVGSRERVLPVHM